MGNQALNKNMKLAEKEHKAKKKQAVVLQNSLKESQSSIKASIKDTSALLDQKVNVGDMQKKANMDLMEMMH